MKIAIWWNIPCKSIVPVARELASIDGVSVAFITQTGMSEQRKSLGWVLPEFGNVKYHVLADDNWKREVKELVMGDFDIHVFNGVYLFNKIRYAVDFARQNNIPFGIISEAYHNPYIGFKRILKTIFTRCITPFRVYFRARKAKFILSASGNRVTPFLQLGWKKNQFFPFGYFPENEGLLTNEVKKNDTPTLLCTGYITKNKGQYLLVKALSALKESNIPFRCIVTGFGDDEVRVKQLAEQLKVIDHMDFVGVVSDKELNYYKSIADLLIAPGLEEPWGIRINEAILAHTPVLVSDGIGASELVKISGAGCVFKSGSVDSLIEALKEQLDKNNLKVSKKKAILYSEYIKPRSAAKYLFDVINYTLNKTEKKPIAKWLEYL